MSTPSDTVLIIELEKERHLYHPGDQIRGSLQLHLAKDTPVGKVSVRLTGHTKSKISQASGQSTSTFRGSAELFDFEQTLYDGHYTHKSGVLSWLFEFEIPGVVDPAHVGAKWDTREGFLATSDDTKLHSLPPSFRFEDSRAGKAWYVLNTYAIEATIVEPGDRKVLTPKTKRLVKVIRILPRPTADPVDVNDPRQRRRVLKTFTVRTLRLLPEYVGQLSIVQKTKSMLNPSKLPRFTFDIDISYPSVVQAYHPQSLPFVVSASPKTDTESTTIQPSMRSFYRYPSLIIKHIRLVLQASTDCRCPSILSDVHAGTVHDITLLDRHFSSNEMSLAMQSLAWDQKNRVEEEIPTSIDFGKECNTVVAKDSRDGEKKGKKIEGADKVLEVQTFITPSFTTYNISRRYHLAWDINFECAGEKMAFRGRSSEEVIVLGPAASHGGELLPYDALCIVVPGDEGDNDDEEFQRRPSNSDTLPAYSEISISESRTVDSTSVGRSEKRRGGR